MTSFETPAFITHLAKRSERSKMNETTITESWQINASEWIKALEGNTIGSRKVTSPAIVETILHINPSSVLDLGCGEGWLVNKLVDEGITCVGIDATNELIERASTNGGEFYVKTYEEIIEEKNVPSTPYEAVVFNFCLYHKEETEHLLKTVISFLHKRKLVIIQTLHPFAFLGTGFVYENQWIDDSWKGLKGDFQSPHKWYYRTMEGWMSTIAKSGLKVVDIKEPSAPNATTPSSVIFILSPDE